MTFFLLTISVVIFVFSLKGVLKRYKNQESFWDLQLYHSDVIGLVVSIGLFVVAILKVIGFEIS